MSTQQQDFALSYEDGILTVTMTPPVSIAGWALQFQMSKRAGGTPLVTKSMDSTHTTGQSGITMVNAGQGVFNVANWAAEVSGLDNGNYYFNVQRLNSGFFTLVSEGFRLLNW